MEEEYHKIIDAGPIYVESSTVVASSCPQLQEAIRVFMIVDIVVSAFWRLTTKVRGAPNDN